MLDRRGCGGSGGLGCVGANLFAAGDGRQKKCGVYQDNIKATSRLTTSAERFFKMAYSEERPAKMRKLDNNEALAAEADAQPQFALNTSSPVTNETNGAGTAPASAHDHPLRIEQALLSPEAKAAIDATMAGHLLKNPEMSKSQQKKIRKKLEWEAGKDARKAYQKSKDATKKAIKAAEKAQLAAAGLLPPPVKKSRAPTPINVPVTLLIDCDFDRYMLDKEIMSLGQQITRSYSDVKGGRYRANMVISSFGGRMKERYDTVLAKHHESWKGVTFTEKFFTEAAKDAHEKMISKAGGRLAGALAGQEQLEREKAKDKSDAESGVLGVEGDEPPPKAEKKVAEPDTETSTPSVPIPSEPQLVYLSSDSEHTLDRLQPYTTYIIGGIVDKNRHKGLCHKRAVELGIPTAKLPIGEYMEMQSRTVLATNHVVEIMVNWLEEGDWGKAFLKAIPKRKEATLRRMREHNEKDGVQNEENDVEEEEEEVVDEGKAEGAANEPATGTEKNAEATI